MTNYQPEPYWSEVANRIKSRKGESIIAGDDEPYYRYKRKKFLSMLNSVNFKEKSVLEIGCGPGGNFRPCLTALPIFNRRRSYSDGE